VWEEIFAQKVARKLFEQVRGNLDNISFEPTNICLLLDLCMGSRGVGKTKRRNVVKTTEKQFCEKLSKIYYDTATIHCSCATVM